jgi:hypothetical protein
MIVTSREGRNQSNSSCSSLRLILHCHASPYPHHKISDDETSIEARQVGGSAEDPSGKIMAAWTFDVQFPCGTQFIFRSLTFVVRGDGDLKMLPPGPAPERIVSAHGQDPWSPAASLTSSCAFSSPAPFAGRHIDTAKLIRGIPVVTSILRSLAGASSSSSPVVSLKLDSSDDYPKIVVGASEDFVMESRLICMVAPNEDPSHNSSRRHPTIGRSEASDARTPNVGLV